MKILIAPDKFKGSLSASEAAENIAAGLRDVLPDAKVEIVPMADGGEGTVEVICNALGGSWLSCEAHDPLGRKIEARYAWIDNRKLAVMEMSEAAGMKRLSGNERGPLRADTFGVGEMILDAARRGAGEIIIGLGGSATNDGGSGMARALGFQFDYEHEHPPSPGYGVASEHDVIQLARLAVVVRPKGLVLPEITAAVDVRNPLLGENGATRIFGPQKGVTSDEIDTLERALAKLADVVAKEFGFDYRDEPGAGAAGGLGFGLLSFCGAGVRPGFDVVAEAVDLKAKMKDVDLVITGEGSLDRQTLEGKTPYGVAGLARQLEKRVMVIVGRAEKDRQVREIFDAVYELAQPGMSEHEQMNRAAELLREKGRELGQTIAGVSGTG